MKKPGAMAGLSMLIPDASGWARERVRESKGVVRGFVEEAEPIINLREWQQRLAHRALPK